MSSSHNCDHCEKKATHLFLGLGDTKLYACDEFAKTLGKTPVYLIESEMD